MDKLEKFLNKFLAPIASYMNSNLFFSTLMETFMRLTPITLGGAVVLLIGNFPIEAWVHFLAKTGISSHIIAAQNATMNALSLFIVFNFSFLYAKKKGWESLSAGLLGIASFLILMPQTYTLFELAKVPNKLPAIANVVSTNELSAFSINYTGASGIIVAIIVGWCVGVLYSWFNKKNLVIKLPDSVPSNVSESLKPAILSGIILVLSTLIRLGMSEFFGENIFDLVEKLVQAPFQNIVSSPISLILFFMIANLLWFFGIHPNMIYGIVMPVMLANMVANQNAYTAGKSMPYITFAVVNMALSNAFGGQGSTIGLVIAMSRAKSDRFKQLFKLASVPSLFNINEPLIFGMPIILNPIFFLPMLLGPVLIGGVTVLLLKLLNFCELNPMISLPWTMPGIIVMFLQGGWKLLIVAFAVLVCSILIWWPFFKIADMQAYKSERDEE